MVVNAVAENTAIMWAHGVLQLVYLCGCLAALNDTRQAWHDQVAGTAIFWRDTITGPDPTPGRGFQISQGQR